VKGLLRALTWPFRHLPIPVGLFLVVSLILAVGFGLAFLNLQRSQWVLRTWEEERQLHLVEGLAKDADLLIEHYEQTVRNLSFSFANSLQLTGLEDAYRFFLHHQTLRQVLQRNPGFAAIAISDGLGRTLLDRMDQESDLSELEPFLAQARTTCFKGQRYISPLILPAGATVPLIVFAEPVTDAGGTHVAAVQVIISLQDLLQRTAASVPSGHGVFICDDKGRLLVRAGSSATTPQGQSAIEPGALLTSHPLVRHFLETRGRWDGLVSFNKEGEAYLGTYAMPRTLPWMVAAETPERIAFASIHSMARRLYLVFTLIMALGMAMTLLLAFSFRQPLGQLVIGAREIIHHEFRQPLEVQASNEFGELTSTFNQMRESILEYLEQIRQAALKNKQTFMKALQALTNAIDAKDPYTKGHSSRVSRISGIIARELGQREEELEKTELSALLHDVGKIGIEDRILKKPSQLSPAEYEIMKKHPEKGVAILGAIDELREITDGVGFHHENWAGDGYPRGLRGEEIPLQARIVAVADAFDAMTTNRPYQLAMTHDAAINRLLELAGKRFDPAIVQALAGAFYAGRLQQ
jgi:putative nucleotidyltransferase with HDIG domain